MLVFQQLVSLKLDVQQLGFRVKGLGFRVRATYLQSCKFLLLGGQFLHGPHQLVEIVLMLVFQQLVSLKLDVQQLGFRVQGLGFRD